MNFLLQCPFCKEGRAIHPLLLLAVIAGVWLLLGWIRAIFRKEGVSHMNKAGKIVIVVVLIALAAIVISLKQRNMANSGAAVGERPSDSVVDSKAEGQGSIKIETSKKLPRLVDLGADKCIPCKMMAPILEELKKEYAGVFNVEFIDVWKNPDAAQQYGIRVIPTQIFFNSSGKELFRHEGFFSKEDILAKWKQFGVELTKTQ